MHANLTSLAMLVATAVPGLAAPQAAPELWHTEVDQIDNPMPQSATRFGAQVDLEGDLMVVGSVGDAWIFGFDGTQWNQEAKILHGGGQLEIDGGRVFVGQRLESFGTPFELGSVDVYEQVGGAWIRTSQISSPSPQDQDRHFGLNFSVDGNRMTVTESVETASASSAVFAFEDSGSGWTQTQTLLDPSTSQGPWFGQDLVLDGDTLVIGHRNATFTSGDFEPAVFVYGFDRGLQAWQLGQTIEQSSFPAYVGDMETDLALQNDTLVVGGQSGPCVMNRAAGNWSFTQLLRPHLVSPGNGFALDGDRLFINADAFSYVPGTWTKAEAGGGVSVWELQSTGWTEARPLRAAVPGSVQGLGAAIASSDGRVAVGAPSTALSLPFDGTLLMFEDLPAAIGTKYCFGDGTGTACWIQNTNFRAGPGCRDGTISNGGQLVATGSTSVSTDDLTLVGHWLDLAPALLYYGSAPKNAGAGTVLSFGPGSQGLQCVAPPRKRVGMDAQNRGYALWGPGVAGQENLLVGSTLYFQVGYRTKGPTGSTSTTNGLELTITP